MKYLAQILGWLGTTAIAVGLMFLTQLYWPNPAVKIPAAKMEVVYQIDGELAQRREVVSRIDVVDNQYRFFDAKGDYKIMSGTFSIKPSR